MKLQILDWCLSEQCTNAKGLMLCAVCEHGDNAVLAFLCFHKTYTIAHSEKIYTLLIKSLEHPNFSSDLPSDA